MTKIPPQGIPNMILISVGVSDANVTPYVIQIAPYFKDKYIETKDGVPAVLDPNSSTQQSLELEYFEEDSSTPVSTPIRWYCKNLPDNVKMLKLDGSPYVDTDEVAIKFVLDLDKPPQTSVQQFKVTAGGEDDTDPSMIIEVLPPHSSIPVFDKYKASMLVGETQQLTAKCTDVNDQQVPVDNIDVTGDSKGTN
jgi:hypothetical protein